MFLCKSLLFFLCFLSQSTRSPSSIMPRIQGQIKKVSLNLKLFSYFSQFSSFIKIFFLIYQSKEVVVYQPQVTTSEFLTFFTCSSYFSHTFHFLCIVIVLFTSFYSFIIFLIHFPYSVITSWFRAEKPCPNPPDPLIPGLNHSISLHHKRVTIKCNQALFISCI